MSSGLRVATVFIGIALCALSIMLNFQLYTSLVGSSNIEKFSYQYIGIALDFSKVICLLLAMYLWFGVGNGKAIMLGVFCFIFYVVLSGISLSAGWGFGLKATANGEAERLKSSMAMQSLQAQVATAESNAHKLHVYAGIDSTTLESKMSLLTSELKDLQRDLAACPRNYYTKCINPKKAQIADKQAEIQPLKVQLDGYNAYQGAMSHKNQLYANMSNLDSGALQTEIMHPLFIATGNLFNVTAQEAKQGLLLVSFIALELLGSLFFAVGIMFNGQSENPTAYGHSPAPAMGFVPQSNSKPTLGKPFKKALPKDQPDQVIPSSKGVPDQVVLSSKEEPDRVVPTLKKASKQEAIKKPIKPRADSDVEGVNSQRFQAVKQAILEGKIKPTLKGIRSFQYGDVRCNISVAKKYQAELLKQGLIQPRTLNNGRTTYQLAS